MSMKKIVLLSAVALAALVLASCGGKTSTPKFPLGEYVSVLQKAVEVDNDINARAEEVKDLGELGKLLTESQEAENKYKEAVKALAEQDMDKDVAVGISEDAPFALEAPLKFGKTLAYSNSIWVKIVGELGLKEAVTLPEGKKNLVVNLNAVDGEGNVVYTKKNIAVFKGLANEEGACIVPADSKAKIDEYIVMKDKAIEDWLKAKELVLVVAE